MMPSMNPTNLPKSVLEAFIPGYSLISRFILDVFGFDMSLVVSVTVLTSAPPLQGRTVSRTAQRALNGTGKKRPRVGWTRLSYQRELNTTTIIDQHVFLSTDLP